MKRTILLLASVGVFALLATGCSHQETSAEAKEKLDEVWNPQVGVATKSQFVEHFGNAEWCRPKESGEESCHRKLGTKWMGPKEDRKHITKEDDVLVEFNQDGILRRVEIKSQR